MKVILLCISLLFFISCSGEKSNQVSIGINHWIGYSPISLAQYNGYFKENGSKVIEYPSATQVIRAFENEVISVAGLTLDETILLANKGLELGIIAITDISNGADALVVRNDIRSAKDLIGKKIGVENTALGSYALAKFLQKLNLNPQQMKIIPVEISDQEEYFINQEVDALVTFEPVISNLKNKSAKVLIDSSSLENAIIDVLVYNKKLLTTKQAGKLKDIWYQSLSDIQKSSSKDSLEHIAKYLDISVENVLEQREKLIIPNREYNDSLLHDESFLKKSLSDMKNIMLTNKIIHSLNASLIIEPLVEKNE